MNWKCKLGLHDWLYVWDHEYSHVCARVGCHAFKKINPAEIGNRRRRTIAVAKLKELKERTKDEIVLNSIVDIAVDMLKDKS